MFDPTAFENMRVVMEGCFYDKDLNGEILITDRNDYMNSAKLSRTYNLSFQLAKPNPVGTCRFCLKADLTNLSAELLPAKHLDMYSGCKVTIEFMFESGFEKEGLERIANILKEVWGERTIKLTCSYEPLMFKQIANYHALISFDRILTEEQIDDLVVMTDYMLLTLEKLEASL
ncbi:hypothetical protein [Bacillus tuaregi]|uniref:hypothetical protein n=1 Tax=Bacillus tuaregi TaxID=1816695 RepID=UPI0008F84F20|nr:hypothetical protein [Bacillus tuaregi]